MENRKLTKGEKTIRTTFNPSTEDYVASLKQKSAELYYFLDGSAPNLKWDDEKVNECVRLKTLAITKIEEFSMFAVKSATV